MKMYGKIRLSYIFNYILYFFLMKQSEKLDIILRYLYERKDDGKEYSISDILAGSEIETNATEVSRLAEELKKDGYIYLNDLSSKLKKAKITAKGITYTEGDSYAYKGNNIVNHYHVVNSPQANIVVNSNQVTINQTQYDKAAEIIREMREKISKDALVDVNKKAEVLECLTEVESGLESKKVPKFAIRSLLGIGSDIASISSLAVSLAQLFQVAS